MPFFEVKVLAQAVVLVEAEDEDKAHERAFVEADFTLAGHKEVQSAKLLEAAEDIDRSRRHCDQALVTAALEQRECPPAGFGFVSEGEVRARDRVWDDSDHVWAEAGPDEIGDNVDGYYAIVREGC